MEARVQKAKVSNMPMVSGARVIWALASGASDIYFDRQWGDFGTPGPQIWSDYALVIESGAKGLQSLV